MGRQLPPSHESYGAMALRTLIAIITLLLVSRSLAYGAGCQQLYRRQAVVAVPYVAPVLAVPAFVYPQTIYQAGLSVELRSELRQAIRAELKSLNLSAPQQQVAAPNVFAKCARCHSADSGRVVLDGNTLVDCHTFARWGEIAGLGRNVPPEMAAMVKALTPDEKGSIADAMLNLGAADKPRPVTVPPVPPTGDLK